MTAPTLRAPPPAQEPPEACGLARDDVGLLVAERHSGELTNTGFAALGEHLREGDLLVVNTSATLPAAVPGDLDGEPVLVHFSTPAGDGPDAMPRWALEVRGADGARHAAPGPGATVDLAGGGRVRVIASLGDSERLAVADLALGAGVLNYLHAHGQPIRYPHVPGHWPLAAYQTVWARDPGSAEMPSAGRPFTAELVVALISAGVRLAPILLHAGVSSLQAGEDPFPERFSVSVATVRMVGATRAWGGRVIAVGTTVVRALESVAAQDGTLRAATGTTDLVVTPERGVRVVDGLITGWHEADASHLRLLEAIAGPNLLRAAYDAAVRHGHRGHEFGDVNLILP